MAPTDRTIGQLVADALDDVRAIIDHEKALAKAEITRAAKAGGSAPGCWPRPCRWSAWPWSTC